MNASHLFTVIAYFFKVFTNPSGLFTVIACFFNGVHESFGFRVLYWMEYSLAKQIGLDYALGKTKQAKFAMLQIMARCINPSSRLHIANYWPEH